MGLHKEKSVVERSDKSLTMLASLAGYSVTPGPCGYTASKWAWEVSGAVSSKLRPGLRTQISVAVHERTRSKCSNAFSLLRVVPVAYGRGSFPKVADVIDSTSWHYCVVSSGAQAAVAFIATSQRVR
jgi:hypothetical protein